MEFNSGFKGLMTVIHNTGRKKKFYPYFPVVLTDCDKTESTKSLRNAVNYVRVLWKSVHWNSNFRLERKRIFATFSTIFIPFGQKLLQEMATKFMKWLWGH